MPSTSVSYLKLLTKFEAYGIAGSLLSWITDVLSDSSKIIKIKKILSRSAEVTGGIPQSSVLGPTLFLIFIVDVCDIFNNLQESCKLYADEMKLCSCYDREASKNELTVTDLLLTNCTCGVLHNSYILTLTSVLCVVFLAHKAVIVGVCRMLFFYSTKLTHIILNSVFLHCTSLLVNVQSLCFRLK